MAAPEPTTHATASTLTTSLFNGGKCSDIYCSSTLTPTRASSPFSTTISSSSSSSDTNPSTSNSSSIVNYYFIFIAILICLLLLIGWLILRRRKRRAMRSQATRQTALSRDLASSGGRGWTYGGLGMLRARRDRGAEENEHEGLDERGEAPPPYKPAEEREEEEEDAPRYAGADGGEGVGQGPSIPLATLARADVGLEESGLKPPDYHEAVVGADGDGGPSGGSSLRRRDSRTD